MNNRYD